MNGLTTEIINHVLDSSSETLDTMMELQLLRHGTLSPLSEATVDADEITTIIGLVSKHETVVRLIMQSAVTTATRITGTFLGEEQQELNIDVIDAMKEIINIIAGSAAAKMPDQMFSLTLPVVLIGSNITSSDGNCDSVFIPLFVPKCGPLRLGLSAVG